MSRARVDPIRDADTVDTELMLADLDSLEKRIDATAKKARGGDKEAKMFLAVMEPVLEALRAGRPARSVSLSNEQKPLLRQLQLLTSKPVLYACNVDEASAATGNEWSRKVEARAKDEGAEAVVISAAIEAEVALLTDPKDKQEFLASLGSHGSRASIASSAPATTARSHHLLHRRPQGSAGLDRASRRQGAGGGGRHPHRFRARLHPLRDHRL